MRGVYTYIYIYIYIYIYVYIYIYLQPSTPSPFPPHAQLLPGALQRVSGHGVEGQEVDPHACVGAGHGHHASMRHRRVWHRRQRRAPRPHRQGPGVDGKRACILSKEPFSLRKEPYILKGPILNILWHRRQFSTPWFHPGMDRKRALYSIKRALYFIKRALYSVALPSTPCAAASSARSRYELEESPYSVKRAL